MRKVRQVLLDLGENDIESALTLSSKNVSSSSRARARSGNIRCPRSSISLLRSEIARSTSGRIQKPVVCRNSLVRKYRLFLRGNTERCRRADCVHCQPDLQTLAHHSTLLMTARGSPRVPAHDLSLCRSAFPPEKLAASSALETIQGCQRSSGPSRD